ncbi:MAG: hypothetical protein AABY05_03020 [Nanoarchaeota archaeon]
MEQKQVTLEQIYFAIQKMQKDLHIIEEKLDWEKEFSEKTQKAWKEVDEGKYTAYNSPEEFLSTFKEKNA